MKTLIIWTSIIALTLAGCATKTQTGALVGSGVGAAVGAAAGQAIGRDTSSTLCSFAIGAAVLAVLPEDFQNRCSRGLSSSRIQQ